MLAKLRFLVLVLFTLFLFCCKKDIAKQYTGNYYFTTTVSWWNGLGQSADSTISYYGSIKADSKTTLTIEFGPNSNTNLFNYGTIHPTIDNNGNLSYQEWLDDGHKSFSGSFNENGYLNITMATHYLEGGGDNKIHGVKY